MNKDEWVNTPTETRLSWYTEKISDLLGTIQKEGVSSSSDMKERLREIKTRMVYDGTPSSNRMAEQSAESEPYYRCVYKAYKVLPKITADPSEWPAELKKANSTLKKVDN